MRRPGFTLIELIVALTIFTVGVLAVASGLGAAARLAGEGRRLTRVSGLILRQLARVRTEGCASAGSEVQDEFLVAWDGIPVAGGRLVRITVAWSGPRRQAADTVTSFQRCQP